MITRDGIKPQYKKIQSILNLKYPRTVKEVRSVLGLIQYYRDLWPKRSHILTPITEIIRKVGSSKKNEPIIWTEVHDKAFKELKTIIGRETLLAYPRFDQPFVVTTDASDLQLGSVISQNGKPLAFYSRKLTPTQKRYTTTEKELLSIVETLKEYRNILYGHEIVIETDHQNIVAEARLMASDRVMRWRLLLEEYGPTFKHVKGVDNVVADAISIIPIEDDEDPPEELCAAINIEDDIGTQFPMETSFLNSEQKWEFEKSNKFKIYFSKNKKFFGKIVVDSVELTSFKEKTYVPNRVRNSILNWYHHFLCHPGSSRLASTIGHVMLWPGIQADAVNFTRTCSTC